MPDATTITERDALVNRQLPEMMLSDGSLKSLTRPTEPLPTTLSAQDKALKRFAVQGNAVVTGGAGTLAIEATRALLEHGLEGVALFDINPSQADESIGKLQADFPAARIITKRVNVTDVTSIQQGTSEAAAELGGIDILCCFAGVVGCTHAIDMSAEEWRRTLDINTTGEFLCAQAAAREMIKQGRGGSIVFVASISGHRVNFPQPQVAYNVSKSALHHLSHSLAAEWARYGIRVNTISPGYMDTILNEGPGLARARNIWAERNPMGRMGQPCELTGPLVLLCSRFGGAYMTGTDLVVDGGSQDIRFFDEAVYTLTVEFG